MTAGTQHGFAQVLVGAGYTNSNYPGSYSGVEPLAQSANLTAFGDANYWNPLTLGFLSPETNPSFSNLLNNSGNPTSVGLQFTGSVDSYTAGATDHGIFGDFIYLNGGTLDWELTGLTPGEQTDLYFYGFGNTGQSYRTFNMALDTNGDGTLDGNYTVDSYTGAYAANILVSPTGTISGQMQVVGGQASWSGFQVFEVPEPSTLVLFWIGLGALLCWRVRRKVLRAFF